MDFKAPYIESSYKENNLGETLYNLVLELKPKKIIEFGTLNGYSAVCMGMALKEIGEGHLNSYDLWDAYKFKHGSKLLVQEEIEKLGLSDFISIEYGDLDSWTPEEADLIHMDISNDGEKLRKYETKLRATGGTVIFEGGTPERDRVDWMLKYNKQPMTSSGVRYKVIEERFPGISQFV